MAKKKKKSKLSNVIATNRKASYEFFLEDRFEAGIVLEGWEVKSIRSGRVNLKEGYVAALEGELFLIGSHISPLPSTSTHSVSNPTRNRKLLLHKKEVNRLIGAVERKGYTMVPTHMYWKNSRVKLQFALGKGKKLHDKRTAIKQRDIEREHRRESSSM